MLYGTPLDDSTFNFEIVDGFKNSLIDDYTEYLYVNHLFQSNRMNKNTYNLLKNRPEVTSAHFFIGRHGTKSFLARLITAYEAVNYARTGKIDKEVDYYGYEKVMVTEAHTDVLKWVQSAGVTVEDITASSFTLTDKCRVTLHFHNCKEISPNEKAILTIGEELESNTKCVNAPPYQMRFEHIITQAEEKRIPKAHGKIITFSTVPFVTQAFKTFNTDYLLISIPTAEINVNIDTQYLHERYTRLGITEYSQQYGSPSVR